MKQNKLIRIVTIGLLALLSISCQKKELKVAEPEIRQICTEIQSFADALEKCGTDKEKAIQTIQEFNAVIAPLVEQRNELLTAAGLFNPAAPSQLPEEYMDLVLKETLAIQYLMEKIINLPTTIGEADFITEWNQLRPLGL